MSKDQTPTAAEAEATGQLVLIAEDNAINREVLVRQLNLLGYAAEVAVDGHEALKKWRERRYGLILTDCHMPEMDGFALTAALREDEAYQPIQTPVVAITANALQGEAERCLASGMDDYLPKPVEIESLSLMLDKWLPRRKNKPEDSAK